ncbi:MAG: divalent-cation tolerance protein CutA [Candidatus Thermoplasmatota archaeon]|nr:divalent-cation tolerance protein CutA [Candidatus Thermoplasmatota archaeon]
MGQTIHVVQTTLPGSWNEAQIGQYAQSLLDHGAACVQIQNIRSVYRWNHQTESDDEWRIQLKTSQSNLESLLLKIEETHPYDTPQLISWPASATDEYGKWVTSS